MQSKSLKFQDPEKIHAASARNHEFSDVIFEGPNFSEVSVALPPYVGAQRCPPIYKKGKNNFPRNLSIIFERCVVT